VVFHILDIDYTWVSANTYEFDLAFTNFIVWAFGVNMTDVVILSVEEGSVIVKFDIITQDIQGMTTRVRNFINANVSMANLTEQLPAAALTNPNATVTLDPNGSSVEYIPVGAIIGAVVGGVALCVMIYVACLYRVSIKKKEQAAANDKEKNLKKERGKSNDSIEMKQI